MKRKILLLSLTILLMLVVVSLLVGYFFSGKMMPIFLEVKETESKTLLRGWEKENMLYFFLPSYASLSDVQISLNTDNAVKIDNVAIETGMNGSQLSIGQPYLISYSAWGRTYEKELVILQSAGLATVYVETQSGSVRDLHKNKENSEQGTVRVITDSGSLEYSGKIDSLSCRGNSSWTETEKKSYSVTLLESADLLNLGSANRWTLLADALDETFMRNRLVYDAANAIGLKYTVNSAWVDLYLNGEYVGLYRLSERNEVHPERVDIATENSVLISGEMESRLIKQNIPYISTASNQAMRIHYPTVLSNEAVEEVSRRLQAVENAILSAEDMDPVSGEKLEELIDIESFVKKYLVDEVFGNIDGGMFSQYYYFDGGDPDGKLYAGPVWDYDLSMGSDFMWQIENPQAYYANRPRISQGNDSAWIYALCKKDAFVNRAVELYQEEVLPYLDKIFYEKVHTYKVLLATAASLDKIRWGGRDFYDQIDKMCEYMQERQAFLNSIWIDEEKYYCVTLDQGNSNNIAYYMVRSGECLDELPELQDTDRIAYDGWYSAKTNEPFDIATPIIENIELYANYTMRSDRTIKQIIKLSPLGIISAIGFGLLVADIRKNRRL